MSYRVPVEEMLFALESVAGLAEARDKGGVTAADGDDVAAILTEAARFAEEELAPLNKVGDSDPARLEGSAVVTPKGWSDAYGAWVEAGWSALTGDPEHGGQGLPMALQVAATDIWNQANAAFALNPLLTIAAVEVLQIHGTDAQKTTYLPHLISGRWSGTMNLTEPQSGSDLSGLTTRAEPDGGRYRLFGQKIYITYGEHDLSENIVHMVLARLPDAPSGTRGISLFCVPKRLVNADGSLGEANDVACVGLEEKLGIHGSPTCTMAYGARGEGAIGELVGEPHKGLAAMFVMMNNARVQVGMQGAAVAQRALSAALAYAAERRQGRAASAGDAMAPLAHHPDVKRMLITMMSLTRAARAVCYACAVAIDRAAHDPSDRAFWQGRADLLTPLAKAFATDIGVEVASLAIQVHGGMGFIEETGVAQHYRDARIFPIYEGTNGIQAIDLVRRKIGLGEGAVLTAYLDELRTIAHAARGTNETDLGAVARRLDEAIDAIAAAGDALQAFVAEGKADCSLAAATPFLRAFGVTAGGAYLAKAALLSEQDRGERAVLARFFAEAQLSGVPALTEGAIAGAQEIAGIAPQSLAA